MELAARAARAQDAISRVTGFFSSIQAIVDAPDALDFTFGNPREMALPGLVAAMREQLSRDRWTGTRTRTARDRRRMPSLRT